MEAGNHRSPAEHRDAAETRRRNRLEPYRVTDASRGRRRPRADGGGIPPQNPAAPLVRPGFLSVSDPLPAPRRPRQAGPVTARKAASEPPTMLQSTNEPTINCTTQGSADQPHLAPSERTTDSSGSTELAEYQPADFSDEDQSYTTASDEPDWLPRPECVAAVPVDSGELADSESSDAEPARRAWFCRLAACHHLNPAGCPLCQLCGAGRLAAEAVSDGAARSAAERPPRRPSPDGRDLCWVCRQRPADHAVLHGGTACRVVCRRCVRRLRRRRQPCPACRRPVREFVTMWRG